jgi:hypothetical protein
MGDVSVGHDTGGTEKDDRLWNACFRTPVAAPAVTVLPAETAQVAARCITRQVGRIVVEVVSLSLKTGAADCDAGTPQPLEGVVGDHGIEQRRGGRGIVDAAPSERELVRDDP